ncbi:MAG: DUF2961 domain-containing protein [Clostridiales bacterium]|nr:DUF2961 domain-containing protein [Clostridiales bacterium]
MYPGITNSISNLWQLSNAKSRSISAENPTGAVSGGAKSDLDTGIAARAARDLGKGWKVDPYIVIEDKEERVIADIEGPGIINHIWCTPGAKWRFFIIRFYWEGQENPSVECPLGDFFASGWGTYAPISSLAVCVNPGSAFNCYWQMPFKKHCKITIENISGKAASLYYQVDYTLAELPQDIAYFHARFNRVNPLPYKEVFTIVDGIRGKGQYVGTYLAWGVNNAGWWGEGEIKFYMDGDKDYPTICGTGTEDYFCGSYNFENKAEHEYETFSTPYAGLSQVIRPDGLYSSQQRFGLYRWHLLDPIRFESDLRVTIQALGWRDEGRYLPLQDDIAGVAFWYQTLPTAPFPPLLDRDSLEII